MEIEGALKRAEAADSTPNRVDPDARVGAASDRVARLEQAIATMGNFFGPEMDVVASLTKAQKEVPRVAGCPDPSERRFHRKGKEKNRSHRLGARSRSSEDGGEPEEIRGTPCSARCPVVSDPTHNRCQRRSESSPADGGGSAATVPRCTSGRLSIPQSDKGGL